MGYIRIEETPDLWRFSMKGLEKKSCVVIQRAMTGTIHAEPSSESLLKKEGLGDCGREGGNWKSFLAEKRLGPSFCLRWETGLLIDTVNLGCNLFTPV